ncbi:hypothetical protein Ahy_B08g089805 isoform F [Arachis hypogaea]|uniref:Uncharacterized protein n=1 Tax=Arachis hypogaea TaxID=3818 RepID=A0A444XYV9_ARAHY|nr:hypothetical protein Ahy_B08g089805 isoform F [Arachis hypogaea]
MSSKALNVFEGDTPTQRADSIPIDPIRNTDLRTLVNCDYLFFSHNNVFVPHLFVCFCSVLILTFVFFIFLAVDEKKGAYSAVGVDQKRGIFTIDLLSYQ